MGLQEKTRISTFSQGNKKNVGEAGGRVNHEKVVFVKIISKKVVEWFCFFCLGGEGRIKTHLLAGSCWVMVRLSGPSF